MTKSYSNLLFGDNMTRKLFISITLIASSTINCYAVSPGYSPNNRWAVICVSNKPMDGTSQSLESCSTDKNASGEYGLMMSNADLVNFDSPNKGVVWSSKSLTVGPNAQSYSNGAANTQAIMLALPKPNDNATNNAAWLCSEYPQDIQDPLSKGYLPAKDELAKVYAFAKDNKLIGKNCTGKIDGGVQCLVGGYSADYIYYWSSTENSAYSEDYAWHQAFSPGYQDYDGKVRSHFGVRAVRVFNPSTLYLFNTLKKLKQEEEQWQGLVPKLKDDRNLNFKYKKNIENSCSFLSGVIDSLCDMMEPGALE